jgi:hypothetical protein
MLCGKKASPEKEKRIARLRAAIAGYTAKLATLHSQAPVKPTAATPTYVVTDVAGLRLRTLHPKWRKFQDACHAHATKVRPITKVLFLEEHMLAKLM